MVAPATSFRLKNATQLFTGNPRLFLVCGPHTCMIYSVNTAGIILNSLIPELNAVNKGELETVASKRA